jgi:hypothetical protein
MSIWDDYAAAHPEIEQLANEKDLDISLHLVAGHYEVLVNGENLGEIFGIWGSIAGYDIRMSGETWGGRAGFESVSHEYKTREEALRHVLELYRPSVKMRTWLDSLPRSENYRESELERVTSALDACRAELAAATAREASLRELLVSARKCLVAGRTYPVGASAEWSKSAAQILDRLEAYLDKTYRGWDKGTERETVRLLAEPDTTSGEASQ